VNALVPEKAAKRTIVESFMMVEVWKLKMRKWRKIGYH